MALTDNPAALPSSKATPLVYSTAELATMLRRSRSWLRTFEPAKIHCHYLGRRRVYLASDIEAIMRELPVPEPPKPVRLIRHLHSWSMSAKDKETLDLALAMAASPVRKKK